MIVFALIGCAVIGVNSLFAAAGLVAAMRYGISATLSRGVGLAMLVSATVVEFAVLSLRTNDTGTGLLVLAFGAVAAGAACDAACGYVFDTITLPCLGAMLLYAAITQSVGPFIAGAAIAGGSLALLHALTRGRGLGLGDVKLACCIGGGAGLAAGIEALGIAFVLGGVYAAYLLVTKRGQRGDELRFAPYMAAGMALAVLAGAFV
jgi:prepilin signal peptidase PulO-like enzyme (type II secretory pathway)